MALNKLNMETLRLSGPPHNCKILRPRAGPDTVAADELVQGFAVSVLLGGAFGREGRMAAAPVPPADLSLMTSRLGAAPDGAAPLSLIVWDSAVGFLRCKPTAAPISPADLSRE